MFISSVMWMKSPFLVSMYTFLIRLGTKRFECKNAPKLKEEMKALADKAKAGKLNDNDAVYLNDCYDKLHHIIKNRTKLFPNKNGVHKLYFEEHSIEAFHNSCGIRTLSRGQSPDKEANTYLKELLKKEREHCQRS